MDLFDDLATIDDAAPVEAGAALNVLAVPRAALNAAEFEAIANATNEAHALGAPAVFEDEFGRLNNPHQFIELAGILGREPTPDEAIAWVQIITGPVWDKWQPVIDRARAQGPDSAYHEKLKARRL